MYYKMKLVASSWLFQGKQRRKLLRLDTLERDSLFHSLLTCLYNHYRHRTDLNEKYVMINRLKNSLMNQEEYFENIIDKENYDSFLDHFSKLFEVNIFLFNCMHDESIIEKTYMNEQKSPYIMLERCDKFYPLGIREKNGIHVMFFNNFDDEVIRCLNMYDKSSLSEKYERKEKTDEFKVDTSHIYKYNIQEYLTSLKGKMIK